VTVLDSYGANEIFISRFYQILNDGILLKVNDGNDSCEQQNRNNKTGDQQPFPEAFAF
jgi:hypothetical protein